MKQIYIVVFIFWLASLSLFGQKSDYARSIVDTLASSYFKGRGYTFDGDKKAAEFIRKEFEILGLTPLGDEYLQPFNIDVNTFPGEVMVSVGDARLMPGIDFLVSPDSPSLTGKYKTSSISSVDLLKKEKILGLVQDSKNRFILINQLADSLMTKEEVKNTNKIINALRYDPSLKHAGIILLSDKKLTWYASNFQAPRPTFIIQTREDNFNFRTIHVDLDAELKTNYETQNVIAMIKGKENADSFLVALAHYDHLGTMGKEVFFPGANDNASGVAMLLSLAKYYSKNQPDYSVLFLALGAEEAGLLGAKAFVEDPLVDLKKIRFLINFDLAGTGEDGIKVVNATVFKDEFARLKSLNQEHSLMESVQPRGEACNSDHCLFYQKGVPCFYMYTLGGIAAYHDVYDKASTLPLTDFEDYYTLVKLFLDSF